MLVSKLFSIGIFFFLLFSCSGGEKNILPIVKEAFSKYQKYKTSSHWFIIVDISDSRLYLFDNLHFVKSYPISTSRYGIGNKSGSNKTPLGMHIIKDKAGDGLPIGAILVSKRFTGKITKIYTDKTDMDQDPVTTRVMHLSGLERGINMGSNIDSYKRSIYIHGTSEEGLIGSPASHGCIRMLNLDVIELFNTVPIDTLVYIQK